MEAKTATEAYAMLCRLEWSGQRVGSQMQPGGSGVMHGACPECYGVRPHWRPNVEHGDIHPDHVGHRDGCELAELIAQGEA